MSLGYSAFTKTNKSCFSFKKHLLSFVDSHVPVTYRRNSSGQFLRYQQLIVAAAYFQNGIWLLLEYQQPIVEYQQPIVGILAAYCWNTSNLLLKYQQPVGIPISIVRIPVVYCWNTRHLQFEYQRPILGIPATYS